MTVTSPVPTAAPPRQHLERRTDEPVEPSTPVGRRSSLERIALGRPEDPRWARPLLWALMLATALLYLVDLSNSGTANDFYAAAVKSGTESWKAWLFGSLDSANSITVDKPPASLWLMVASARLFGFSSISMLLPQALMGIGTVALTYAGVRRWSGHAAGLVAGALVTVTPVAALMFRFDNPDALLVFLMTAAAYFAIRAIDGTRRSDGRSTALRWLLLAGSAIGFAFLTKMFQGLLVLPAFGLVYLVAAQGKVGTPSWHLLAATGSLVVSAGWFVVLVSIWPASARPYIGGSTNNSLWELAIGYNGLSRVFGGSGNGSAGGAGGGMSFGGASGIARMFGTSFGSEISWLLPAALLGLIAGLVVTRRAHRTDKVRAGLLLWGGWLVVTALVLSFMSGTVHPYHAVALAPVIAAVVAVAGRSLWTRRHHHLARIALAVMVAGTAAWSFYLLNRDAAGWLPWLRCVVLAGGLLGAAILAVAGLLVGSLAAVGATGAFTAATAATGHIGDLRPVRLRHQRHGWRDRWRDRRRPAGRRHWRRDSSDRHPSERDSAGRLDDHHRQQHHRSAGRRGWCNGREQRTHLSAEQGHHTLVGRRPRRPDRDRLHPLDRHRRDGDRRLERVGRLPDAGPVRAVREGRQDHLFHRQRTGHREWTRRRRGQSGESSSVSVITAWVEANFTTTTIGGTTVYNLTTTK